MDITFCTFYFDIARKNWKHFTVSNEMYMFWFENLLSLDINLYIVTEKKFINRVLEARKKIRENNKNKDDGQIEGANHIDRKDNFITLV